MTVMMGTHGSTPNHSSHDAWQLRIASGSMAWNQWPLTHAPLIIGRGIGCHVRIDDPHVSRVQCEVSLVSNTPRLRHRSTQNATLVNGAPQTDTPLRQGDTIEFAGHRIVVERVSPGAGLTRVASDPATTKSFSDSRYLRGDSGIFSVDSDYAAKMTSLFALQRSLARCESSDDLIELLRAQVADRLGPGACWLAWRVGTNDDIALVPAPSAREREAVPVEGLKQALALMEGILTTHVGGSELNAVAAPLVHGSVAFGAIAIGRTEPDMRYTDTDLEYLLAVAECAAPLILAAERMEQLQRDNHVAIGSGSGARQLVGTSRVVSELRETIARLAIGHGNILLEGETGVGKEMVARMIHDASPRATGPYVAVNCAAIPNDLFESEMFGYERGAFSGATHARKGLFEQAHGGTLFLDEVGEMSVSNQARILRIVETMSFRRLGTNEERVVDARIISATNRGLRETSSARFRQDLFYRLASVTLRLPPLRDRAEDIPELARHFLSNYSATSPAHPVGFSDEATEALLAYSWPGNVRELRNVVEHASITATERIISKKDVAPLLADGTSRRLTPKLSLADLERNHLIEILRAHEGNVAETAEVLGIAASTLYHKLRRFKISLRNPK